MATYSLAVVVFDMGPKHTNARELETLTIELWTLGWPRRHILINLATDLRDNYAFAHTGYSICASLVYEESSHVVFFVTNLCTNN